MNRVITGWFFVAIQGVLLGALILLPGRDDWSTPTALRTGGQVFIYAGLAVVGVAALGLGRGLTATPVPSERGVLITNGFYRFVRHPIYTGVLAIVVGLTVRSGSFVSLAVAVITVAFFTVKARWEEERLAEHYPGYADYAAVTPRFVPRPRLRRASPVG